MRKIYFTKVFALLFILFAWGLNMQAQQTNSRSRATAYCATASTADKYDYISHVVFGSIDNATGLNNYSDYTAMSTDILLGGMQNLQVTVKDTWGSGVYAWIDWNHDFVFSSDEAFVLSKTGDKAYEYIYSSEIRVPVTALEGSTRMRIIAGDEDKVLDPCDADYSGEVEDYTVNVKIEGVVPNLSVDKTVVAKDATVVFTDASIGAVTEWEWNFGEGATPATAKTKAHNVSYSTLGKKSVTLTVRDAENNEKTLTFTDIVNCAIGAAEFAAPTNFGAAVHQNVVNLSWTTQDETPTFTGNESFESGLFPPAGWSVMFSNYSFYDPKPIADGFVSWQPTDAAATDGDYSAYISSEKTGCNWLITPEITVADNQELSFDMYYTNSESDYIKFYVKVFDGTDWSDKITINKTTAQNLFASPLKVDLSEYVGKKIKVAFVQEKTYDDIPILIDNVSVKEKSKNIAPVQVTREQSSKYVLAVSNRFNSVVLPTATKYNYNTVNETRAGEVLSGFNIYKNNLKIATVTGDVRSYTMNFTAIETATFAVTAIYGPGQESFVAGYKTVTTKNPEVDFTADKKNAKIDEQVTFTTTIKGHVNSYVWDFGQGATVVSQSLNNAVVTYSSFGEKTVSLTVNGNIVKEIKSVVTVKPGEEGIAKPVDVNAISVGNDVTVTWNMPDLGAKLSEGFEGSTFPPAGWDIKRSATVDGAQTTPADDAKVWFQNSAASFSGKGAKFIHSGDYSAAIGYSAKDCNWLITPEVSIADGDNLKFWLYYTNGKATDGTYYYSNFRVMVYADGAWNQELFYTDGSEVNNYTSEVVVDLAKYNGKAVKIAFVQEYTDGYEMMIDDIKVSGSVTVDPTVIAKYKFNIYHNDIKVGTVPYSDELKFVENVTETANHKYFVTLITPDAKESFPSVNAFVKVFNKINAPYSQNFEAATTEWVFNNPSKLVFKVGATADFPVGTAADAYKIPDHNGKYVAVNTSLATTSCSDIAELSPINLSVTGQATIKFDYIADIQAFALVGRVNPNADWTIIKQLDYSKVWSNFEMVLPDECYVDGYQFGLFYNNLGKVSNFVGFDNISISTLTGKHIEVLYNNNVISSGDNYFLSRVNADEIVDYSVSIKNIGSEPVDVSNISIAGDDAFSIKSGNENNTLALHGSVDLVINYAPKSVDSKHSTILSFDNNSDAPKFTATLNAECGLPEWTYMVYLYEDGTGLSGIRDFNEWEVLGSIPGKLNYIVLFDADDDSKDGIYYVQKDNDGMNSKIISKRISTHMNEGLNMDDYKTLEQFIVWGKQNFPAKHYGVNVWDHGSGIFRKKKEEQWKAACGEVQLWEVSKALKTFKDIDGKGFDIFGFDVCLLGQVETIYQLKDYCDIVVASEKTEPGNGWEYTKQFAPLNANPEMNIEELARNFVVEYDNSYDNGSQGNQATTQTAVNTKKFNDEFIPKLNEFADIMMQSLHTNKAEVKKAIDEAWYSDGERFIEHKDLGHFLKLLKANSAISADIKTKIDELYTAYEACIIATAENQRPNATGLKIWIPEDISVNKNTPLYLNAAEYLTMSETHWDEFLKMYENPVAPGAPVASINVVNNSRFWPNETVSIVNNTVCFPLATSAIWVITPNSYELVGCDLNSETLSVKFLESIDYKVSLTVVNADGSNTKEETVNIRGYNFISPVALNATYNTLTSEVTLNWKDGVGTSEENVKLYEDFEAQQFPARGWDVKYSDKLDGAHVTHPENNQKWVHCDTYGFGKPNPQYIHSGDYSASIGYNAKEFSWLISPEVNIENTDKLKFWVWYKNSDKYFTNFRVMVLADGDWNQELFYTKDSPSNEYASEVSIDLAKYAGKNVKVAFVYEFTDGFQLMVDDIKVVSSIAKSRTAINSRVGDGELKYYEIFRDDVKIGISDVKTYVDKISNVPADYNYHVVAVYVNPDGKSVASNKVKVSVVNTVFYAPKELSATLDKETKKVSLVWKAPTEDKKLVSYKVFRDGKEIAGNISTLSYEDQLSDAAGSYEYYVTAIYTNPDGESLASNKVIVKVDAPVVLNAPTDLTATLNVETRVAKLSWTKPEGDVVSYNVFRNNENIKSVTTLTYDDQLSDAAGDYEYYVTAVYADGESLASNKSTVKIDKKVVLNAPTDLTATLNAETRVAKLSWTKPEGDVVSYNVFRNNENIKSVTTLTYDDQLSDAAGDYEYYVTAVYAEGESLASNKSTVKIDKKVVLNAPTDLTSTLNVETRVAKLSWTKPEGDVVSYNVFRNNENIKSVTTLTYDDQLSDAAGDYEYYVTAVYADGESLASNKSTVKIDKKVVLNAPTDLTATLNAETRVAKLSWTKPEGDVVSYNVFRNNENIKSVTTLTYDDQLSDAAGDYEYYVTAVYADGESLASNKSTVKIDKKVVLNAPTDLTATLNAETRVAKLSWTKPEGDVVSYNVFRNNENIKSVTTLTYDDQLSDAAGDYEYYVTAVYAEGESVASNKSTVKIDKKVVLNAPTDLTATLNAETRVAKLSWTKPEGDVVSYNVFRNNENIKSVTTLTYDDQLSDAAGDYEYYVTAVYAEGESVASNKSTVKIDKKVVLNAPTDLTATLNAETRVAKLSWTKPEGDVVSYNVFRNNENIKSVTTLTYDDQLSDAAGDYEYYVTAVYAEGESVASNKSTVKIDKKVVLNAPTDLTATLNAETRVAKLSWTKPEGDVVSYNVFRNNENIKSVTTLTYDDQLSDAAGDYEYYVTAVYAEGESVASNKATIKIEKKTPTAIGDGIKLDITAYPNPNNGTFTLNVNDVKEAKWYLLDINGRMINSGVTTDNNTIINVEMSGVYMVKVVADGKTNYIKIVVK